MEKNKIKFFIPIILMFVILIITSYKIVKNREDKLYQTLDGKIEFAFKKCYLKGDCEEKTTLEELYNLNYLEILYDPVTKEMLDKNIIIEYKEDKVIINK